MSDQLFKRLVNDIRVELTEEFDRNFERKAFFDDPWPDNKFKRHRGTMMARTNRLRRSVISSVSGGQIIWSSSTAYADIHNRGGKIKVTAKMKRFFWAKYYESTNAKTYSVKTRSVANSAKNKRLSAESEMWKAMALKKVGDIITIPRRQFIGTHPQVDVSVRRAGGEFLKELETYLNNTFKKHM